VELASSVGETRQVPSGLFRVADTALAKVNALTYRFS
jgi:hypothetical protein